MESKLWILVQIRFLGQFGINTLRYEKDAKKRGRAWGLAAAYTLVSVVLIGYCFAIAYGFGYLGMSEVVPGYALTITSIVTLLFTFLKTNGVLFGAKDYDLLMSLPVKTTTVITAKFISMYVNNLIFAAGVMIPMGVGYCIWSSFRVSTILMWVFGLLFTPLLPMTIAAIAGMLIAGIGSGFRHKVFVQVVLTAALMLGIFAGSFWVQGEAMKDEAAFVLQLADLGGEISDVLHGIYPLAAWFDGAIAGGKVADFLLFAGVSIVTYMVFAFVCGKWYRKINTALKSHHAASNYKLGELKSSSVSMAIAKKEAKRFTSSTVYMTNTGMGLLLALLLAVSSIFVGVDKIIEGMEIPGIGNLKPLLEYLMPFALAVVVNMCNTTSVSLSLEGRSFWVVQSLPVTRKTLLKGKMLFNILLVLPVSLVCSVIFSFVLRVNGIVALEYLLFSVVSVLFSTIFGMWVNLHFPNFSWENEVEVVKQAVSSMLGIFGGILGYLALGTIAFLLLQVIKGELVLLIISAGLGLVTLLLYKTLR